METTGTAATRAGTCGTPDHREAGVAHGDRGGNKVRDIGAWPGSGRAGGLGRWAGGPGAVSRTVADGLSGATEVRGSGAREEAAHSAPEAERGLVYGRAG